MRSYELNIHPETIREWEEELNEIDRAKDHSLLSPFLARSLIHARRHYPLLADYVYQKIAEQRCFDERFVGSYQVGFSLVYNIFTAGFAEKGANIQLGPEDMAYHRGLADRLAFELQDADRAEIFRGLLGASNTNLSNLFAGIAKNSPAIADKLRRLLGETENINMLRLAIYGICDGFLPFYSKFYKKDHTLIQEIDESYTRN